MSDIARIIALGASNLTRGLRTVVSAAQTSWGHDIQIFAALGYGRSYGAPSRVAHRTLPGILDSGLWRALESMPQVPTRALVTDVGNDIMYGYSVEQILSWVEEALGRLHRITGDIILTDLPLENIQRLSGVKYLAFRSLLFRSRLLSLTQVLQRANQINSGLAKLSAARNVKLFHLNPAWYSIDPIHIRPSRRRLAWQTILGTGSAVQGKHCSIMEILSLCFMAPERRWILGSERFTPQSGIILPSGGRVWLF